MRLLQSTWAELLTLTTAFRSLEQSNGQSGDVGSDINSIGVVSKDCSGNGLKLRYATDYWLDERLARECCSPNICASSSSNGTTTTTSTIDGTAVITTPTVLDIYNLVSIIGRTSLEISLYYKNVCP